MMERRWLQIGGADCHERGHRYCRLEEEEATVAGDGGRRGRECRNGRESGWDGIEKVLLLIGADATVWGTRKTSCRRTPWQRREEAADSRSGGSRRRRRVVADKR
ncbi:hypothetical protein GW17_00019987 [Ensete ventricosum]|nr:hypothetical protein GW17_00019987 [Ensete ventricosum]